MGLFNFFKKEKKTEKKSNVTMLGMVLLKDPQTFNINDTVNELRKKWNLEFNDPEGNDETVVLTIEDYTIAMAKISAPIPAKELEATAEYNYFWENGTEESAKHKGHIILSIMNAGKDSIQENLLFSKIASAIMNNSNALGIYIGGRTLVLEKAFYQSNVELMSETNLPLYNWIYFGLRKKNGKQSVYTFGLADFGKTEMEILDSDNSLTELNEMLYNLSHYVVASNVTLKDGETIGLSAEQKLKITKSKGRFLDGKTLKIEF